MIHLDAEPTNSGDTAPTTMTAPPLLALSDVRAARCACAWLTTRTRRPWYTTSTPSSERVPSYSPTNGRATTISFACTQRFVTVRKNGRGMMMAMASVKYTSTRPRACGRPCATFCVPSEVPQWLPRYLRVQHQSQAGYAVVHLNPGHFALILDMSRRLFVPDGSSATVQVPSLSSPRQVLPRSLARVSAPAKTSAKLVVVRP